MREAGGDVPEPGEVWEDPLDSERRRRWWHERYLPTLERLAALDAGHILVTRGRPAVGGGAAALRRALERDPWQRSRPRRYPSG